jgi:hypothetical protein
MNTGSLRLTQEERITSSLAEAQRVGTTRAKATEGRGEREEEEGRGKREEGRGTREEGRGKRGPHCGGQAVVLIDEQRDHVLELPECLVCCFCITRIHERLHVGTNFLPPDDIASCVGDVDDRWLR